MDDHEAKKILREKVMDVAGFERACGLTASQWLEKIQKSPWIKVLPDKEIRSIIYLTWRVEL
jgi:hypothetical protein